MKNHLPVFATAIVAILLVGLYFHKQRPAPAPSGQAAISRADDAVLQALQDQVARLEARLENKDIEIANLKAEMEKAAAKSAVTVVETSSSWVDPDVFGSDEAATNAVKKSFADVLPEIKIGGLGGEGDEAVLDLKNLIPKAMQQQQQLRHITNVERTYADLYDQLGLDEEQAAALQDLLVRKASVNSARMFNFFEPHESPANVGDTREVDGQIKDLLGDEAYAEYETYETTKPSRKEVNRLQGMLASRDLAMTADQRQRMIDLHHELQGQREPSPAEAVLSNFGLGEDIHDSGVVVVSSSVGGDPQRMDQALEKRAADYDKLLTGSQEFLDERQVAELGKHFDRQMQKKEINASMVQPLNIPGGENGNGAVHGAISISIGGAGGINLNE